MAQADHVPSFVRTWVRSGDYTCTTTIHHSSTGAYRATLEFSGPGQEAGPLFSSREHPDLEGLAGELAADVVPLASHGLPADLADRSVIRAWDEVERRLVATD
jgi:hypothetical protein